MVRVVVAVLTFAVAACGCGLDVEGIPGQATAGPATSSAGAGGGGGVGQGSCAEGQRCAPAAADSEPVLVRTTSEDCPAGWAEPSRYAPSTDQPGCSSCSCTSTGSCAPGKVIAHDNACSGVADTFQAPQDGACLKPQNDPEGKDALTAAASTPSAGTCAPGASAIGAAGDRTICRLLAAGDACADGSCVPAPAAGDELCVLVPDGSACPAGWKPTTVYEVKDESGACTCQCGKPPIGTCAGGSVAIFDNDDCTGAPAASYPADSACNDTGNKVNDIGSILVTAGTWSGPDCSGTPMGTRVVTFGPPDRLCCP